MKKIIFSLIIIIININVNAEKIEYTTSNGKYTTKIEKNIFNNYKYQLALSLKKMINCKEYKNTIFNPIYGVNLHYNTLGKNKNNKCVIDINNNSLISYRCALKNDILKKLIYSKIDDIKNNFRLEDINKKEAIILNDNKFCKKEILKKIPNQEKAAMNKLKNDPELYKILQGFQ